MKIRNTVMIVALLVILAMNVTTIVLLQESPETGANGAIIMTGNLSESVGLTHCCSVGDEGCYAVSPSSCAACADFCG